MSFPDLRRELLQLFSRGIDEPLPDDSFNDLALRVFRFQGESNPGYAGFLKRRGLDPASVAHWEDLPFLPTGAFKTIPLIAGSVSAERVFRTSGTTRGAERRGEHHVRDLALYRASLQPNFKAHLLPDRSKMPVLCLLPSPVEVPDSSLAFMMDEVGMEMDEGGARFFVSAEGEVQVEALCDALERTARDDRPVLIAGTAFAFVQWLDGAMQEGWARSLPPGSRILETGGYKGRSRAVTREDLYAALGDLLNVPVGRIVNEYGMTELLSQFYEPVLADAPSGSLISAEVEIGGEELSRSGPGEVLSRRFHRGPPWTRTLVLDPSTLDPAPPGEVGLLAHLDLANLGSVSAVLTEDLGREVPGGFQLLGRTEGAEPRGCSLAMEDFLASLAEAP